VFPVTVPAPSALRASALSPQCEIQAMVQPNVWVEVQRQVAKSHGALCLGCVHDLFSAETSSPIPPPTENPPRS
jgi:hypothetical protein